MIGDQYADVLFLQTRHNTLDIFNRNWIYASKGLIEQNKTWINGQGPGDFCAPALPSTQEIPTIGSDVLQAEFIQ